MLPLIILLATLVSARSANPLGVTVDEKSGQLNIHHAGKSLLVYSFASNQFKPYVKELRTLRGANVLLDSPADHLHHHGLMYAIRINGTNFWGGSTYTSTHGPAMLSNHGWQEPSGWSRTAGGMDGSVTWFSGAGGGVGH